MRRPIKVWFDGFIDTRFLPWFVRGFPRGHSLRNLRITRRYCTSIDAQKVYIIHLLNYIISLSGQLRSEIFSARRGALMHRCVYIHARPYSFLKLFLRIGSKLLVFKKKNKSTRVVDINAIINEKFLSADIIKSPSPTFLKYALLKYIVVSVRIIYIVWANYSCVTWFVRIVYWKREVENLIFTIFLAIFSGLEPAPSSFF